MKYLQPASVYLKSVEIVGPIFCPLFDLSKNFQFSSYTSKMIYITMHLPYNNNGAYISMRVFTSLYV